MRCAILTGLVLLAFGCGDDSTASHAGSCSALGDPEVSCRFVGRFSGDANRSTVVVKTDEGGSLQLLIGPRGGKPRYRVWGGGLAADGYSGEVEVAEYLGDVSDYGTLEVEIVDMGRRVRLFLDGGSFFAPATFEGVYVGR